MQKAFRFLPAVILIALLAYGGYSMLQFRGNSVPKEDFFGCYAHPDHGRFDISDAGLIYNGTNHYKGWSGTKMSGPPQIIGRPHFARIVQSDGSLEFDLVKSGDSARDFYGFTDGPAGERALIVTTRYSGDLIFSEIPCTP